jgi:predicted nucleic acid-binding Zn ribbon protein
VSERRRGKPVPIGDALSSFLEAAGLGERVEQAAVIPEWSALVGPTIADVTSPLSVSADGTLVVAVATHAWMTELSLMEPELLRALNEGRGTRPAVRRIRWLLRR